MDAEQITSITTTMRQIAHLLGIGLALAAIYAEPIAYQILLKMPRTRAWRIGWTAFICWLAGLYVTTGQGTAPISRAAVVPLLAAAELSAFVALWIWVIVLASRSIERKPKEREEKRNHNGGGNTQGATGY